MKNNIGKLLRAQLLSEGYFNTTIDNDVKRLSARYVGRGVTWYGDKDQMVVLDKDDVYGMWGNIYDKDKLEFVTDLIRNHETNVEFECSYGMGGIINFTDILEEQTSYYSENFATDYEGKTDPASTGNDEVDKYVGTEEIEDLDFISTNVSEEVILQFFNKNRFSLIYEKSTVNQLKDSFTKLGPDEYEVDAFEQFIEYEVALKEADVNDEGDFNRFTVQLRDGHHRVFGAIDAGEQYVCVNLDKESIERYPDYITKVSST